MSDTSEPTWIEHAAIEIAHWIKDNNDEVIKLTIQPSMFMYASHRIAEIIQKNYEERRERSDKE